MLQKAWQCHACYRYHHRFKMHPVSLVRLFLWIYVFGVCAKITAATRIDNAEDNWCKKINSIKTGQLYIYVKLDDGGVFIGLIVATIFESWLKLGSVQLMFLHATPWIRPILKQEHFALCRSPSVAARKFTQTVKNERYCARNWSAWLKKNSLNYMYAQICYQNINSIMQIEWSTEDIFQPPLCLILI